MSTRYRCVCLPTLTFHTEASRGIYGLQRAGNWRESQRLCQHGLRVADVVGKEGHAYKGVLLSILGSQVVECCRCSVDTCRKTEGGAVEVGRRGGIEAGMGVPRRKAVTPT